MAVDLFAELGFDPDDPEVIAAREDAAELTELLDRLVALRKTLGLRQADVATAMATTQSAVSDLERLGGDPRITTVQRYARALGARVRVLVDDSACWVPMSVETGDAPPWTAAAKANGWSVSTDQFALAA